MENKATKPLKVTGFIKSDLMSLGERYNLCTLQLLKLFQDVQMMEKEDLSKKITIAKRFSQQ